MGIFTFIPTETDDPHLRYRERAAKFAGYVGAPIVDSIISVGAIHSPEFGLSSGEDLLFYRALEICQALELRVCPNFRLTPMNLGDDPEQDFCDTKNQVNGKLLILHKLLTVPNPFASEDDLRPRHALISPLHSIPNSYRDAANRAGAEIVIPFIGSSREIGVDDFIDESFTHRKIYGVDILIKKALEEKIRFAKARCYTDIGLSL